MIEWVSVKDHLPIKSGIYLTIHSGFYGEYIYEVLDFSLNLYGVDKYDFPKKQYKNKKGFYYLDRDYGFEEQSNVEFWAALNPPSEGEEIGGYDAGRKHGLSVEIAHLKYIRQAIQNDLDEAKKCYSDYEDKAISIAGNDLEVEKAFNQGRLFAHNYDLIVINNILKDAENERKEIK